MALKIVQINIYAGMYLDAIVDFIKRENPDFVTMQEVTGGGENRYVDKNVDLFDLLKNKLGMNGAYQKDFDVFDVDGYMGNAVLSKHQIVASKAVILKPYRVVAHAEFISTRFFPLFPRHMLDTIVKFGNANIHVISIHGAWVAPPQDTAETLRQARIAAAYLKGLNEPFLLAGDLNNVPESKTIGILNKVANNLMIGSGVAQTTHPKIHKIVPRGYLVDYIFASKQFKLVKLEVAQVTISDHLPVVAELTLAT